MLISKYGILNTDNKRLSNSIELKHNKPGLKKARKAGQFSKR